MPFHFERQAIADVVLIEPHKVGDHRGFFMETYRRSEFVAHGITDVFVQDNLSRSVRGVLRGLHYQQHPQAQGKLVMVLQGEIFDVAVDIRRESPTYGKWVGLLLSADRFQMLYIPAGFAHGFCVLSETADFTYKVTSEYNQALDRGILWNDPEIGIDWPIKQPTLSARDARLPVLAEADNPFVYQP